MSNISENMGKVERSIFPGDQVDQAITNDGKTSVLKGKGSSSHFTVYR